MVLPNSIWTKNIKLPILMKTVLYHLNPKKQIKDSQKKTKFMEFLMILQK